MTEAGVVMQEPEEVGHAEKSRVGGIVEMKRGDIAAIVDHTLGEGVFVREGLSTRVTDALCKSLKVETVKVGDGMYYPNATKI